MSKPPVLTLDGVPQAVTLSERIHWIGALDPSLRTFDIILKTANGTSYNAYVVDQKHQRMGGPLTEKEKEVLRVSGKISKEEMEQMIVDDIPSPWRLACQMIVRDEDILVEY